MKQYDAIIIGSGQGGTPLAKKLAGEGWKTALIEKNHVGGTCINVGCTPTKAMIASAKAIYTIGHAESLGVKARTAKADMSAIIDRKNAIVERFRSSSKEGLEKTENLDLIYGAASFTGEKKLRIRLNSGGETELTANKIFIDAGTHPSIPSVEGLAESGYLTSTTLMELTERPAHLLIIGGGYIGLEFGQMYRRFGCAVTILEHHERFLSREDEDIAAEVKNIMEAEDIVIHTGVAVTRVARKDGGLQLSLKQASGEQTIECSHILVSAGRTPNTKDLNLAAAGVETDDKGYIKTNDRLETTAKDVYAIGDIKGGPAFTHISYDDYRVLFQNLVQGGNRSISERPVPYTMFTDPQLGRVGITEAEGRKKGLNIKVATLPMAHVARAIEVGDTRGMMKAVVDADSGQILGAAILGAEGGETMTLLQMAMEGGVTWQRIRDMVIAHPLYAEALNNLFMKLDS